MLLTSLRNSPCHARMISLHGCFSLAQIPQNRLTTKDCNYQHARRCCCGFCSNQVFSGCIYSPYTQMRVCSGFTDIVSALNLKSARAHTFTGIALRKMYTFCLVMRIRIQKKYLSFLLLICSFSSLNIETDTHFVTLHTKENGY